MVLNMIDVMGNILAQHVLKRCKFANMELDLISKFKEYGKVAKARTPCNTFHVFYDLVTY